MQIAKRIVVTVYSLLYWNSNRTEFSFSSVRGDKISVISSSVISNISNLSTKLPFYQVQRKYHFVNRFCFLEIIKHCEDQLAVGIKSNDMDVYEIFCSCSSVAVVHSNDRSVAWKWYISIGDCDDIVALLLLMLLVIVVFG